ncbi:MAG: FprA family A-type flavoprotein [Acidaminococcaceae bacterium]
MKTLALKPNFFYCGVQDRDLRVFDIVMTTQHGTTYNSYLLKTAGQVVLFETAKEQFFEEYLASIEALTKVQDINYLVMNHTEPDHAGSVARLLALNPQITVIGTVGAMGFLRAIMNCDFKQQVVKDNATLVIGDRTLRFLVLPNLHWPDTMFTYIEEDKVLLTCDVFGAHYCPADILRSTITDEEGYLEAVKYYFDGIIGPFKQPFMTNALRRIAPLDIDLICTGHGPVLDSQVTAIQELYHKWCVVAQPSATALVVIPYVSAYGYTKALAESIAEGIRSNGKITVELFDLTLIGTDVVLERLAVADGILLGSPTLLGDALKPIWEVATAMLPVTHKGKVASAFGSYGWSGEAVPNLLERLRQLKMKVLEGYRVRFKPSSEELVAARAYGQAFGLEVLTKRTL